MDDLSAFPAKKRDAWAKSFSDLLTRVTAADAPNQSDLANDLSVIGEDYEKVRAVFEDDLLENGFTRKDFGELALEEVLELIEGNLLREVPTTVNGDWLLLDQTPGAKRPDLKGAAIVNFEYLIKMLRKPESTELTDFLKEAPISGAEVSWLDARDLVDHFPDIFVFPRGFDGDDLYSQTNRKAWQRDEKKLENTAWWDFGSDGILIRLDALDESNREDIEKLDNGYELLDDDLFYELEGAQQKEAYDEWGRSDAKSEIVRAIRKHDDAQADLAETLLDEIPDGWFDNVYYDACNAKDAYIEGHDDNISFPNGANLVFKGAYNYNRQARDPDKPPTLASLLDWLAVPAEMSEEQALESFGVDLTTARDIIVTFSDACFCRADPAELRQGASYPGAKYIKYGSEYVYQPQPEDDPVLEEAFQDSSNVFIWQGSATTPVRHGHTKVAAHGAAPPSIVTQLGLLREPDELFANSRLTVQFALLEQLKDKWFRDHVTSELVTKAISYVIDAGLSCGFDPAEDMARDVAEAWLWLRRDEFDESFGKAFLERYNEAMKPVPANERLGFNEWLEQTLGAAVYDAFLDDARTQKRLHEYACREIKELVSKMPPICEGLLRETLQQKLPGVEANEETTPQQIAARRSRRRTCHQIRNGSVKP